MGRPNNPKSSLAGWYDRLVAFKIEDLFSRRRPPGPPRTIFVNEPLPASCYDGRGKLGRNYVYTANQVITSKYTIITFLPRNLLEQFRRVANMFFLGIAILQFFPKFATISPATVILPLIVILTVTALKDGYEDFKRHQSDERVNRSKVLVLGNWSNPNKTQGKSKSLTRWILSKRSKLTDQTADPNAQIAESSSVDDLELDVESNNNGPDQPRWEPKLLEDLCVGDFVKIVNNEPVPADILICATSEEENVAFVETKNLDGETNLKSRRGVLALSQLRTARQCADTQNSFRIQCESPDTDMYRLNANVTMQGTTSSADLSTTLLRGTVLRNTSWAIGVVLFTGLDTKIVMNSGGTPSKRSKVERQMNPQVLFNLTILAAMATVCAVADSVLEKRFFPENAPWLFDDDRSGDNPRINGIITWAFALLTFQAIVPISLYISIEVVRTCQAAFIYFDSDIWYEKTNQATNVRSWNLSDDLGQIEYIFSDKTGTLTQNSMIFRMCSIGGKAYRGDTESSSDEKASIPKPPVIEEVLGKDGGAKDVDIGIPFAAKETEIFKDSSLHNDIQASVQNGINAYPSSQHAIMKYFFTVLSLCHTVVASTDSSTGKIEYKAQSPDEAALVQAAADMGFVFLRKDKEIFSIQTPRSLEVEKFERLEILDFTSARKRMSVVLRRIDHPSNDLLLLTKGADNVIFERLRSGEEGLKMDTEKHLNEFASEGLRTLTLAYRLIPLDEYEAWSTRYHAASIALEDREKRIESVSNELEQDLCLLGATAIEDRLQDGVPEAIADLKKAGIRIWVATGDKLETAVAIGRSANLIGHDSNIIIIRGGSLPVHAQMVNALLQFFPEVDKYKGSKISDFSNVDIPLHRVNTGVSSIVGPDNGDRPGGFILVVDGAALLEAFADEEDKQILLGLTIQCDGVICCRVSPLQKALIVLLVKDNLGAMTLAIGDGANDVSMIQAADVGIGISGEEGLQAVNSSDYGIAQFRFLKKLLLVHGHWSYARNGMMIINFFYKNIVPTGVLWWFQISNAWSANYVFDYIYILFWNSLWTIAAVVGIGLFDRFLDSHVLMQVPQLYRYGREGSWFGTKYFFIYLFDGLYQSAIIYFIIVYAYGSPTSRKDGYDVYLHEFSTTMAIAAVLVANLFTGFHATAWTAWLFFFVFIGTFVQWIFTVIYSLISPGYAVTMLYGNDYYLFRSAYFWLALPITFVLALAPRFIWKAFKFAYMPGDLEIFQVLQTQHPKADFSAFSKSHEPATALLTLKRRVSVESRRDSRGSSVASLEPRLVESSGDLRPGGRIDMATGITSVHRGFDFATEEHGVEMRRVQSNLSERRITKQNERDPPRRAQKISTVLSLPRNFLKRKPSSPPEVSE